MEAVLDDGKAGRAAPAVGWTQDIFCAKSNIVPLPMIERASGIRMWDEDGNAYIDASSGPMVSNIGHGNARVADAMAAQARTLDYAFTRLAIKHEIAERALGRRPTQPGR